MVDIDEFISKEYLFEAHKNETLQEHTKRCIAFYEKIIEKKKLSNVLENIELVLLKEASEKGKKLFYEITNNVVVFHDMGKMNPGFQKEKMKNPMFEDSKVNPYLKTRHSFISAVIYMQYFLPQVEELKVEEKKVLRYLIFVNAYVISKHHSRIAQFDDFINKLSDESDLRDKQEEVRKVFGQYINSKCILSQDYIMKNARKIRYKSDKEKGIYLYAYERLMYSLLVASDYYATTQNEMGLVMKSYGTIDDIENIYNIYEKTKVNQSIRNYKRSMPVEEQRDINSLRTELFLEAENNLLRNKDENIFFLEAPTGGGKSNTALNLSYQLIRHCKDLNKIMYIYPFNTLVEQNRKIIEKSFKGEREALDQIRVVNSITPIWRNDKKEVYDEKKCQQALLDRQFFNYPIALSTHVTLFEIMFGGDRESAFSFHQLANTVVVLDEIQSYRNIIWTEIIVFLKVFAKLLNMKVIIMSATLPNLDFLSREQGDAVRLIENSAVYFQNPCFKQRVTSLDFSLFNVGNEELFQKMGEVIGDFVSNKKKVLVEFIEKKAAEDFYNDIKDKVDGKVYLLTGEDNSIERARILRLVEEALPEEGIVLVATQVIEAGVDINNMEIGFKDISTIDSEEQFIGRINRSNKGEGKVFFFNYTRVEKIYRNDVRTDNRLTLQNEHMRKVLESKNFNEFYDEIMKALKNYNDNLRPEQNIDKFWDMVYRLDQGCISERMTLIKDENNICNIFFARTITLEDGEIIDGSKLWAEYKGLLERYDENYAVHKVKISEVRSKMNHFIYKIRVKNPCFAYSDLVGELFYIDDGDGYFEEGKLNKKKLLEGIGEFI